VCSSHFLKFANRIATVFVEPSNKSGRLGRYTAHICFHLYNMYEYVQDMKKQLETDEGAHVPNEVELRAEINRVGLTLAGLMDR
jgi:hypothetical protein